MTAYGITGDATKGVSEKTSKFVGKDLSLETIANLLLTTSDVNKKEISGKEAGSVIAFQDGISYGLAISKGSAIDSGWDLIKNIEVVSSADLADETAEVNLPANGKFEGQLVVEDMGTTYRLMVSSGALAASPWQEQGAGVGQIVFQGQITTGGGNASEAETITGIAATDLAFVTIVADGAGDSRLYMSVCTENTLTVTFDADPGADTIYNYIIFRPKSGTVTPS